MPRYFIEQGVHRCVAAREAGLEELPAVLHVEDQPDRVIMVRLSELYTLRAVVHGGKTARRDLPGLIAAMQDDTRRSRVPLIHVQPVGAFAQPKFIPLVSVVIGDHEEDIR